MTLNYIIDGIALIMGPSRRTCSEDEQKCAQIWDSGPIALCRRFFITRSGLIGFGPVDIRAGDSICVLLGGKTPFAVRSTGSYYEYVGKSYVHGIMDGEVTREKSQPEWITLVKISQICLYVSDKVHYCSSVHTYFSPV